MNLYIFLFFRFLFPFLFQFLPHPHLDPIATPSFLCVSVCVWHAILILICTKHFSFSRQRNKQAAFPSARKHWPLTWHAGAPGPSSSLHACSDVSCSLPPYGLCSLPGSSVHGIFQAKILQWVIMPLSRGSQPRDQPRSPLSPAVAGRFFTTEPPGKMALLHSPAICPRHFPNTRTNSAFLPFVFCQDIKGSLLPTVLLIALALTLGCEHLGPLLCH